jgi:hypothetical protein
MGEMQRAVQEFKAQTTALGARAAPRSAVKVRSGSTQMWHGRVFENFRNDLLDAIPHEIRQRGSDKSLLRRNQFGFNVTGPLGFPWLLKPIAKTYLSLSYEGVRERISRTSLNTIPIAGERTGDFSQTVDAAGQMLPIYDPASTSPNPAFDASQAVAADNLQYLRSPFPSNRIPPSRFDRTAASALALYPAPNAAVGPFNQNNFFINSPETNVANGVIGKVDHTRSTRQRFSVGFNYSNGTLGASKWFDNAANPGPANTVSSTRRASVEHVYTASSQIVNTATADASSGIWNTGTAGSVFPVYQFAEYLGMGRAGPFTSNVRNVFTFTDRLSMRKGRHSLRVASQVVGQQVNSLWDQYPDGYLRFSAGLTSLPGIVDTGHSFASFLLGLPEYAERTIVESPSYFRNASASVSVGDQYELRKNLTVSMSATAVRRTPRVEKYDRQSTISLDALNSANGLRGALVVAGKNGIPRGFWRPEWRVDSSIGIAWSPGSSAKTVLRSSYGRSHGAIPIYFGQWGTQGFNGYQELISSDVQLEPAMQSGAGFPAVAALPNLSPDAANDTVADLVEQTGRTPLYYSAAISAEREFPGSIMVTLWFGQAGGDDLLVGSSAANPNAIPLDALKYRDLLNDENFNSTLRPYPQYKGLELNNLYPWGRYQRDAGFVRVEKSVSNGVSLSATFVRSKQMDDYSGPYGTQDYYNRRNEWSLTAKNRPQTLQFTCVYELPTGANHLLFDYSDWRRHLVDGWSLSGSGTYLSGLPLALTPLYNNTGGVVAALHVNAVPGVNPAVEHPGPGLWYNPAAFDQPADFTIGDVSRTHPTLRGPSAQNYDLSLNKRLPIGGDRVVELSASAFNFLNHADWNDPDVTIGPASAPNLDAGKIIGSHGGRVVQLGLRFSF